MNNISLTEERTIEKFLPAPYQTTQVAIRWQSKQSIDLQLYAIEESQKLFNRLRGKNTDVDISLISLASKLIVANKIYDTYKKAHRKNSEFQSDDIRLLDLLEANNFIKKDRVTKKRNFLESKLSLILKWRSLGISLRNIAAKLITPDAQTVSYEYLRLFLKEKEL